MLLLLAYNPFCSNRLRQYVVEWPMLPGHATEPRSVPVRRSVVVAVSLFFSLLTLSETGAQGYVDVGFDDLPPPADSKAKEMPPKLVFRLLAEIPLPGPLPSDGPRLRGDLV